MEQLLQGLAAIITGTLALVVAYKRRPDDELALITKLAGYVLVVAGGVEILTSNADFYQSPLWQQAAVTIMSIAAIGSATLLLVTILRKMGIAQE